MTSFLANTNVLPLNLSRIKHVHVRALQYTSERCSTRQSAAVHVRALQYTSERCSTRQNAVVHSAVHVRAL
ncbi:uncharacterized [Tachysurus ichikawai]